MKRIFLIWTAIHSGSVFCADQSLTAPAPLAFDLEISTGVVTGRGEGGIPSIPGWVTGGSGGYPCNALFFDQSLLADDQLYHHFFPAETPKDGCEILPASKWIEKLSETFACLGSPEGIAPVLLEAQPLALAINQEFIACRESYTSDGLEEWTIRLALPEFGFGETQYAIQVSGSRHLWSK